MNLANIAQKSAVVALIAASSIAITLGVVVGMHMALLAAFTAMTSAH